MAAVSQKVLNWLYSVLTLEYLDINRTYGDVAQVLSSYSSLSPRTEVYTFENGSSALLLQLSGTIPVSFRGSQYRFPVTVWVPYAYPKEPPMVYVVPLQGMIIRPGQHISGEGRVYHPYLANWEKLWDRSNLQDFFAILRNVFSKEPPIVVQQNIGPPPVQQSQSPPPIPPLPQELEQSLPHPPNISNSSPVTQQPPPPPPKPRSQLASNQSFTTTSYANSASGLIQGQPNTGQGYQAPAGSRYANSLGTSNLDSPPRADVYRGPPTLSQRAPMKSNTDSPVSPVLPQDIRWRQQEEQNHISQVSATAFHSYGPSALSNNRRSGPYDNRISQNNLQPQLTPNSRPNPKNIPNLLDTPADLILPQPSNLPVPPVPPNPEKDHLLQSLGIALFQQRQASQAQSQSSLHSLEAQHHALSNAASGLQAEIEAIEELSESLISNEKILKTSMQKAEQVMADAQRRAVPRVDDVLVAPTTVATQLYDLVAEERAIGDAIFILARGMDKGRIGMDVFLKNTRSLAREQFLKKTLIKSIAKGMGLEDG